MSFYNAIISFRNPQQPLFPALLTHTASTYMDMAAAERLPERFLMLESHFFPRIFYVTGARMARLVATYIRRCSITCVQAADPPRRTSRPLIFRRGATKCATEKWRMKERGVTLKNMRSPQRSRIAVA